MRYRSLPAALLAAALLAGCAPAAPAPVETPAETPPAETVPAGTAAPEAEADPWGIQLAAEDAGPSGLTLVCRQSGGRPTGDLQTGTPYWVEVREGDAWTAVEPTPSEYERAWTTEAWDVPMDDSVSWDVAWTWYYGELPAGHYRIGKRIRAFRAAGDYDTREYYAEFDLPVT